MYADDSSGVGNDSYVKLAEAEADVAAGRVKPAREVISRLRSEG